MTSGLFLLGRFVAFLLLATRSLPIFSCRVQSRPPPIGHRHSVALRKLKRTLVPLAHVAPRRRADTWSPKTYLETMKHAGLEENTTIILEQGFKTKVRVISLGK